MLWSNSLEELVSVSCVFVRGSRRIIQQLPSSNVHSLGKQSCWDGENNLEDFTYLYNSHLMFCSPLEFWSIKPQVRAISPSLPVHTRYSYMPFLSRSWNLCLRVGLLVKDRNTTYYTTAPPRYIQRDSVACEQQVYANKTQPILVLRINNIHHHETRRGYHVIFLVTKIYKCTAGGAVLMTSRQVYIFDVSLAVKFMKDKNLFSCQ